LDGPSKPAAREPAVGHHPEPSQPEHVRTAGPLGIDLIAQATHGGTEQPAPGLAARGAHRGITDRAHRASRDALDQLERDVSYEAVHDHDVGDAVHDLGALDVAHEV